MLAGFSHFKTHGRRFRRLAVVVFALNLVSVASVAQQNIAPTDQQIDAIFERFNGELPGCAVGVIQDGTTVFSKGYGLANIEHSVPITPQTMFYMASLSKQFTALAVLLLEQDGMLQLTDSVRETIPELPSYADDVTIYHLLTHTSGIRVSVIR